MVDPDQIAIKPIVPSSSLRNLAYEAIKSAITEMDIYGRPDEVRLDERKLSQDLGVSRTPVREALSVLEQEGLVRSEARRGVFVVKKTKQEIVGMIQAWAALESMAARLACERATDAQLKSLRKLFPEFYNGSASEHLNEYSDANIRFHQEIIALGQCKVIEALCSNLLMHVRSIRSTALRHRDRASNSIKEHVQIINALENREADLAERLVREHGLGLAQHVHTHGDYPGESGYASLGCTRGCVRSSGMSQHDISRVQRFDHPGRGRERARPVPKGRQVDPQSQGRDRDAARRRLAPARSPDRVPAPDPGHLWPDLAPPISARSPTRWVSPSRRCSRPRPSTRISTW